MSTRRRYVSFLVLSLLTLLPSRESLAAEGFTLYLPIVIHDYRLGSVPGNGGSGIQVQNLDPTADAQIVVDLYNQDGSPRRTLLRPNVAAGSAANIYLPAEIRPAGLYAAVIHSDRPIAAIARTDWYFGGDAAIYSHALPGPEVTVPLVVKAFGGQSSLVSIQNTDIGGPTTVEVEFYRSGSATALATFSREIRPGTSITLDVDRDPAFAGVANGILGSMRVKSQGAPVAVQAFMDIADRQGLYAYEGAPPQQAAARLYAPLIRNDLAGTTGIAVVNPGEGPVEVSVTYIGNPVSPVCAGRRLHGGRSFTVAAKDSAVFYQGNVGSLPTGDSGLPKKCVGTAIIDATGGPVLAIVNDADRDGTANSRGTGSSAAYNAFTDAEGSRRVALPLFRKEHTGSLSLTTGIMVMNIGQVPAQAIIAFTDSNGRPLPVGSAAQATIPPGGSHLWLPTYMPALPPNVFGSATISSDQPVVVVVNDASDVGKMDSAIYSGIKAD